MAKSDLRHMSMDLSRPPQFLYSGRFIADEAWMHRERVIDSWELIVGLEGVAYLWEEERRYTLEPGDILFFQPGLRHGGWRESLAGSSFFWVHFRPEPSAENLKSELVLPRFIKGLQRDRILVTLRQLMDVAVSDYATPLSANYLTGLLLLEIQQGWLQGQGRPSDPGGQSDGWFAQLLEWARMQFDRPLTVEALARQAGRNPDYLARYFRKKLGITPLAYIHGLKLEAAKHRLLASSQPIKQIAFDLGFPDERQFSRLFKKRELMSPRQYRNSYSRTRLNRD